MQSYDNATVIIGSQLIRRGEIPETECFDSVEGGEYFDAVGGMVVVAVINQHAFLHNDFLFRIASVEDPERVVRKTVDSTQRTKRT